MRLLTLKTILAAIDFDDSSAPALRTAARLTPLAGARLHLLHVAGRSDDNDAFRLREYYRTASPDAAEPEDVEVIAGSAADVIVERAVAIDADCVIMGPHRGAAGDGGLGSTAARVVRHAPCPCLVAAGELDLPLQRVLAAIDLSPVARGALSVALSWASALRPRSGASHLTALHWTETPRAPHVEAKLHEEVRRARTRAGGAAGVDIQEQIAAGDDAVDGILRTAAAERAGLLVMGTRGATDASSGLGSVSAAVARVTPCPLLLVPPATWIEHGETD